MSVAATWAAALPGIAVLAAAAWGVCTVRRNVGLVDIFWSLFFLLAAVAYATASNPAGPRTALVLVLVTAWSLRLAAYLASRNWSAPEDHRYQKIRARNQPHFALKSLYLVFGLQGLLAWIISAPLAAAMPALRSSAPTADVNFRPLGSRCPMKPNSGACTDSATSASRAASPSLSAHG